MDFFSRMKHILGYPDNVVGRTDGTGALASRSATESKSAPRRLRVCRFESMESRNLLSVSPGLPTVETSPEAIVIGMVYYEDEGGDDIQGDQFSLNWTGGAEGTQLTRIVIETDKFGDGLTIGDALFDSNSAPPGVYGSIPLTIISSTGISSVTGMPPTDAQLVSGTIVSP